MTNTLEITITNVNDETKYIGSYKKIFDIIESDIMFYSPYGVEEETLVGTNLYVIISPRPEIDKIEKIGQLKNVIVKQLSVIA